jgi:hypothetical protein
MELSLIGDELKSIKEIKEIIVAMRLVVVVRLNGYLNESSLPLLLAGIAVR